MSEEVKSQTTESPDQTASPAQDVKVRVFKVFAAGIYRIQSEEAFLKSTSSLDSGSQITVMTINPASVDLRDFFSDGGMLVSSKDIK